MQVQCQGAHDEEHYKIQNHPVIHLVPSACFYTVDNVSYVLYYNADYPKLRDTEEDERGAILGHIHEGFCVYGSVDDHLVEDDECDGAHRNCVVSVVARLRPLLIVKHIWLLHVHLPRESHGLRGSRRRVERLVDS